MRAVFVVVLAIVATACTSIPDVFVCKDDTQCQLDHADGRCEPSGYCSFPAADCPSQYRYDRSTGEALKAQCVLAVDCSAPFTPVDAAARGTCSSSGTRARCTTTTRSAARAFKCGFPTATGREAGVVAREVDV